MTESYQFDKLVLLQLTIKRQDLQYNAENIFLLLKEFTNQESLA